MPAPRRIPSTSAAPSLHDRLDAMFGVGRSPFGADGSPDVDACVMAGRRSAGPHPLEADAELVGLAIRHPDVLRGLAAADPRWLGGPGLGALLIHEAEGCGSLADAAPMAPRPWSTAIVMSAAMAAPRRIGVARTVDGRLKRADQQWLHVETVRRALSGAMAKADGPGPDPLYWDIALASAEVERRWLPSSCLAHGWILGRSLAAGGALAGRVIAACGFDDDPEHARHRAMAGIAIAVAVAGSPIVPGSVADGPPAWHPLAGVPGDAYRTLDQRVDAAFLGFMAGGGPVVETLIAGASTADPRRLVRLMAMTAS